MDLQRRDFLKAMSGAGAAAVLSGARCETAETSAQAGRSVMGLRAPPLDEVRVGFIGVGHRGPAAVVRLSRIPKARIVAICDVFEDRVAKNAAQVVAEGRPKPDGYFGSEDAYKKLCERPDVNLVYVCTPWAWHVPMALHAMQCGKHVCVEVPIAMTVADCWKLVDMAEQTRLHCMMLENCCYGEDELFALTLARNGLLGELVHGDCGYIHELRGPAGQHLLQELPAGILPAAHRQLLSDPRAGADLPVHGDQPRRSFRARGLAGVRRVRPDRLHQGEVRGCRSTGARPLQNG